MVGTKRFRFRRFDQYAEPTPENMEKLNSIRSLYYAHKDTGLPPTDFCLELYQALGDLLMGSSLDDLDLRYVEFIGSSGRSEEAAAEAFSLPHRASSRLQDQAAGQAALPAKQYQVVCHMRIEPEEVEPLTYKEALAEKEHLELLQPENIYRIEEVEA